MDMPDIHLSGKADLKAARKRYEATGRVQVGPFLTDEAAKAIHHHLEQSVDWWIAYNEDQQACEVHPRDVATKSPAEQQRMMRALYAQARNNFQYIYQHYFITDALKEGRDTGHPLHDMDAFVQSDEFVEFIANVTGIAATKSSDIFASCYMPGHFLTPHDDKHDKHDRLIAYVMNFTPVWNAAWGGELLFYDENDNVVEGFRPTFNVMNIFRVPMRHAVEYVTPFAGAKRLSIAGWMKRA